MYLDGVRVLEVVPIDIDFDAQELLIGCDNDVGILNCADGVVDEVRVYGRTLDDGEIAALANM
jgi:hypothetical protein